MYSMLFKHATAKILPVPTEKRERIEELNVASRKKGLLCVHQLDDDCVFYVLIVVAMLKVITKK